MSDRSPPLTDPQAAALAFVGARCDGAPGDPSWRVTVNFHPDRAVGPVSLLQAVARDGRWRSQFETGTSNGGLSAHPGGDRWRWEHAIFGGAYDAAPASARPTYGALDHARRGRGAAPRFGSAHLVLRPEVVARCTFCWPDSVFEPRHFGVAANMGLVEVARDATLDDPLDAYVEAHVHGPLRVPDDVERLVLDPCFRGTAVEAEARRWGCAVAWHGGYRLAVGELRGLGAYRGPEVVEVGVALARDGALTPDLLGAAARAGMHDPLVIKRLWHVLAAFGEVIEPPGGPEGDGRGG